MSGEGEVQVIALVRVKEGAEEQALEVVRTFLEPTHEEEGCLAYALHRDTSDPRVMVLVERWRSQADLDAHFTRPHMANLAGLADLVDGPTEIHFLEPVPLGDATKGRL